MFVNAPLRNLDTKELSLYGQSSNSFVDMSTGEEMQCHFMKCQLIKNDGEICVECRKSPPKDCPPYIPDDLPKYTPQQMSDLGRCSICKNWHFFKQPRSRDTKDCCIRKCSCKSCWKSILAVKSLIFLYVGTKLTRKSLVCRFLDSTNYTKIMKSRDTNERGRRRKPKMMKI